MPTRPGAVLVWGTALLLSSVPAIVPAIAPGPAPLFPNPLPTAGLSPNFVVSGDFNEDGHPDMAAVNNGSDDVSILLGRGQGAFAPEVRLAVGDAPGAAVVGDFNDDGHQDLAITNYGTLDVSVLLGRGDGTFLPQERYAAGDLPTGVAAGDFNGDHHLDLAVANAVYYGSVSILLGTGTGSFLAPDPFAVGASPNSIVVGDLNEDGLPDLAVANFAGSNPFDSDISILIGEGNGAFAPEYRTFAGVHPVSIAAGDLDHDGHLDLTVANFGHGNAFGSDVSVLLGDGHGHFFGGRPHLGTAMGAWGIAMADVNGDANQDLVVSDRDAGQVLVFPGRGDGSFTSSYGVRAGYLPNYVAIDDFNGDGRPDVALAFASDTVAAMLNDGAGHFGTQNPSADVQSSYSLTAADLNGDGLPDLIAPRGTDISVVLSQPGGIPGAVRQVPAGDKPVTAAAGDFNGDGRQDLAIANATVPGTVSILIGHGDGSFDPLRTVPGVLASPGSIAVGDFNRDGNLDLAVSAANGYIETLLGQGNGNFVAAPAQFVHTKLGGLAVGDLNMDGNLDVVVAAPNSAYVLLGIGNGSLEPPSGYPAGTGPGSVVVADLNRDGHPDVAESNPVTGDVSVFLGLGDGTLGAETRLEARSNSGFFFTSPGVIVSADFNHDDRMDLAVANYFDGDISVFAGRGDGSFRPQSRYLSMLGPIGLAAADFNGDGKPDLAISGQLSGLWVLLNQSGQEVNEPPTADAGTDQAVECAAPGGAQVQLDGSGSSDPDSTPGTQDDIVSFDWFEDFGLPTARLLGTGERLEVFVSLGTHHVTLQVTDSVGNTDIDDVLVTVSDTTPPVLSVAGDPGLLWPPNHTLVPVEVGWQVGDLCDPAPSVVLVSASSSEPDDAPGGGDGKTVGDIGSAEPGTPDSQLLLRAERDAEGPGRTYTLLYAARDAAGNTAEASAVVTVPHDLGSGPEPILLQVSQVDPRNATRIAWPMMPGATGYDVIKGDLQQITSVPNHTFLGTVQVLARSTTQDSIVDDSVEGPAPGNGFFYLVQPRTPQSGLGYGSASSASPLEPLACVGGCP